MLKLMRVVAGLFPAPSRFNARRNNRRGRDTPAHDKPESATWAVRLLSYRRHRCSLSATAAPAPMPATAAPAPVSAAAAPAPVSAVAAPAPMLDLRHMTCCGRKVADDGAIGGRSRCSCCCGNADARRSQTGNYDRSHCGVSTLLEVSRVSPPDFALFSDFVLQAHFHRQVNNQLRF